MVHNYTLCCLHGTKPYITQPVVESRIADLVVSGLIPGLDSYLLASSQPMFEILLIIDNSEIRILLSDEICI